MTEQYSTSHDIASFYANGRTAVVERRAEFAADNRPVVYMHGSAPYGRVVPTLEQIAAHGRDAWSVEPTHERTIDARFAVGRAALESMDVIGVKDLKRQLKSGEEPLVVSMQQYEDALALLDTVHEKEQGQSVDIIAQSASVGVAVLAAWIDAQRGLDAPQAINSLTLVSPGGMLGYRPGTARRIMRDGRESLKTKPSREESFMPDEAPSYGQAVREQMKTKGFKLDGLALKYGSIAPLLVDILQSDNHPKVSIVLSEDDRIFPARELQDVLENLGIKHAVNLSTIPGAHAIRGRKDALVSVLATLED